jgi:hypothetical protein
MPLGGGTPCHSQISAQSGWILEYFTQMSQVGSQESEAKGSEKN